MLLGAAGDNNNRNSQDTLRIDRMTIKNFRNFSELHVSFDSQMTVIVAPNGCGKSAVLDAIAVALGPFVGAFDVASGVHFKPSDIRRVPVPHKNTFELEPRVPLEQSVEGIVDSDPQVWRRTLNGISKYSKTTYGEASNLIKFGKKMQTTVRDIAVGKSEEIVLPLVSYYGTGRLWNEKRLSTAKKASIETSRTSGYTDCLYSSSHYKIFVDWFRRISIAEWEERDNPVAFKEISDNLSAIRNAVDCVLQPSGWRGIRYKSAKGGVVAEHSQHGQLSVDWLSDGIRNMIALSADIAHRAVRLNSHLGSAAVSKTPGIVLIDEVDMHLHPEWQQTVLHSLQKAFPLIQFIVTTHSPQVLTTIKSKNIRMLEVDNDGNGLARSPSYNTYAEESKVLLEDVMKTPSRPPLEIANKLKEYQNMVELGNYDSDKAKRLRMELEDVYGPGHVEFQMADMDICRHIALKKREDKQ